MEILQVEDVVKVKHIPVLDLEFVKHKVSRVNAHHVKLGIAILRGRTFRFKFLILES